MKQAAAIIASVLLVFVFFLASIHLYAKTIGFRSVAVRSVLITDNTDRGVATISPEDGFLTIVAYSESMASNYKFVNGPFVLVNE